MVNFMLCVFYHKKREKDTSRCGKCDEENQAGCPKREAGVGSLRVVLSGELNTELRDEGGEGPDSQGLGKRTFHTEGHE